MRLYIQVHYRFGMLHHYSNLSTIKFEIVTYTITINIMFKYMLYRFIIFDYRNVVVL
jgi:hypothetical protein